jgi:hypothetical protein
VLLFLFSLINAPFVFVKFFKKISSFFVKLLIESFADFYVYYSELPTYAFLRWNFAAEICIAACNLLLVIDPIHFSRFSSPYPSQSRLCLNLPLNPFLSTTPQDGKREV